jgi:hypothetical protein
MRKQASESPEVTGGLGESQPRSPIGVSGRPGASAERRRAVPSQGICLAERVQSVTREGQGRSWSHEERARMLAAQGYGEDGEGMGGTLFISIG